MYITQNITVTNLVQIIFHSSSPIKLLHLTTIKSLDGSDKIIGLFKIITGNVINIHQSYLHWCFELKLVSQNM